MFDQQIKSTEFTTEDAERLFANIRGDSYRGDVSCVSTLRALLAPRILGENKARLRFFFFGRHDDRPYETVFGNVVSQLYYIEDNDLIIFVSDFKKGDGTRWMNFLDGKFCETMGLQSTEKQTQWVCLQSVTEFFKKSFDVSCFINHDRKITVLFINHLSPQRLHYLQCAIPVYFPWYFDANEKLSIDEMNLLKSLCGKDSKVYERCITKIAEQFDFRLARIKKLLSNFEKNHDVEQGEEFRRNIDACIRQIDSLNRQIESYIRTKSQYEMQLLGLETKISSMTEGSEIMDYFIHNKNLVLEKVEDGTIEFSVKTYLEYFDEDCAERIINNKNSYIYRSIGVGDNAFTPDDIEMLMRALFLDGKIRLRVCAAFRFNIDGCVTALSGYNFARECSDYMPNPHIDTYRCLGSYQTVINERLNQGDYIGAIEQCVASCKSLNFGDTVVASKFAEVLLGVYCNEACIIEFPDGSPATLKETLEKLKNQEV